MNNRGNNGRGLRAGAVLVLCVAGLSCRGSDDQSVKPGGAPAASAAAVDEKLARELCQRAETFLQETLSGLKPGAAQEMTTKEGHYLVGDLFKCGHEVAVAAFLITEKVEVDGKKEDCVYSPGLAFYSRKGGRWELRDSFPAEGEPLANKLLELKDLSGDGVPEVLFMISWGVTGNEAQAVYRYDRGSDSLICAAEELGRPEWDGKQVLSCWKDVMLANSLAGYDWAGNKLRRRWESRQDHRPGLRLVGREGPAFEVHYTEFDPEGKTSYAWKAIGNLLSFRNGLRDGGGAWDGPDALVEIRLGDRRRLVRIAPEEAKVWTRGLEDEFPELVSRAVFERPEKFSPAMTVSTSKGRSVKIADCAKVEVDEDPKTVTAYECFGLSAEWLKPLRNVPVPGSVIVSKKFASGQPWDKAWQEVFDGAPTFKSTSFSNEADVCVYLRSPEFKLQGYCDPADQFVVRSARFEGKTLLVECEILGPGPDKTAPERTVNPVVMLNLGRLAPGDYEAKVTVTGPGGKESFGTNFKVAAEAK